MRLLWSILLGSALALVTATAQGRKITKTEPEDRMREIKTHLLVMESILPDLPMYRTPESPSKAQLCDFFVRFEIKYEELLDLLSYESDIQSSIDISLIIMQTYIDHGKATCVSAVSNEKTLQQFETYTYLAKTAVKTSLRKIYR